jgi:hypothetical protein
MGGPARLVLGLLTIWYTKPGRSDGVAGCRTQVRKAEWLLRSLLPRHAPLLL